MDDINTWLPSLELYLRELTVIDYSVIVVNITLIIFARPLLKKITSPTLSNAALIFRISLLRVFNILILIAYYFEHIHKPFLKGESASTFKILSPILIMYLAHLLNYICQHFIQKQYGKEREIAGEKISISTYQTRVLSILAAIFITIVAIISIVKILGFDSLLEAGGVIGFIGVMLALTQASWAPDIISGLIFLNSSFLEEGDIIEIDDRLICRIYKTKLFHTELLNLTNNHRIMIRNAKLRDKVLNNLSKFASLKGLRDCLSFNIGYDVSIEDVKTTMASAFEKAVAAELPIEGQHQPEVKLLQTADHGLTWGVIYYTKNPHQIVAIRRDFREVILRTASENNISLATPLTHNAEILLNGQTIANQ